jgi:hypothetical protein
MIDTRIFTAIATSVLVLSSAGAASAQEPAVHEQATPVRVERQHTVNFGMGTLWDSPSLTYEYLAAGGHGLLLGVNAFYARHDTGAGLGAGASVGYRWHWSGRQDSGFLGLNAGFDRDRSPMRITTDGMSEDAIVHTSTFYLVGNIGKRWMIRDRVNITARLGAGMAVRRLDTDAEEAKPLVGVMETLLGLVPVTLDGELSVGYSF